MPVFMMPRAIMPVLMPMMIAGGRVARFQRSRQKCLHRRIRRALHARVQGYAHLRKRSARAFADAAANQRFHAHLFKLPGQRAVPSAVGLNYLRAANRAVFNLINLCLLYTSQQFIGGCHFMYP